MSTLWAVPTTPCHIWLRGKTTAGYGVIYLGRNDGHAVKDYVHRASWRAIHGEIPVGMYVCHRCDNPACYNPDHLFLGTHRDNMKDRDRKGRCRPGWVPGERNGEAKLTEAQVHELRRLYATNTYSFTELSKQFSISLSQTIRIVKRQSWCHV